MITVLKSFNAWFFAKSNEPRMTRRQREIEAYLSKSVDRCDLERRERELERKGYFY